MSAYFTADPHFGHANIIKYCNRPFADADAMDAALLEGINSRVKQEDTLYIIGDFCMGVGGNAKYTESVTRYRQRILCQDVVLIWGNHDQRFPSMESLFRSTHDLLEVTIEGQHLVLCHYAMRVWNRSHTGRSWHLFGHTHGNLADDPEALSFDVGVDCWNFRPLSFAEVAARMEEKKANGAGKPIYRPRE